MSGYTESGGGLWDTCATSFSPSTGGVPRLVSWSAKHDWKERLVQPMANVDNIAHNIGKLELPATSVSLTTTHGARHVKNAIEPQSLPSFPQLRNVAFPLEGTTLRKRWTWTEIFIPPYGTGRTIIDFRWSTVLALVKTTDASGNLTKIYASLVVSPGIMVWNPFVQASVPTIQVLLVDLTSTSTLALFPEDAVS